MRISPKIRTTFFSILATTVVLLATEALARVAKTVEDDVRRPSNPNATDDQWSIPSLTTGWDRRPGFKGRIGGEEREFDASGYLTVDSAQVADQTQRKIVFIGDSNTFGFGASMNDSFVEVVDRLLPAAAAINLAVPGYSSYQGLVSLEQYLSINKADLVVASFNFNDRRSVLAGEHGDGRERFRDIYARGKSSSASRALAVLEISYLFKAMRRAALLAGVIPRPMAEVSVDTLRPRVDEESYRRNLTAIVELTRTHSIPLVLLLLKDNPILTYQLNEGVKYLTSARPLAIAHLAFAADESNPLSDLARVYLASAYRAEGNTTRAERVAGAAPRLGADGGEPIRLDAIYNEIMSRVARDNGVELVDGGMVVDERPAEYIDQCHFNANAHRRLGELLADRIARILRVKP